MKIGLCNFISGGGKDTVANELVSQYGFDNYAFSDGIYTIAEDVFHMEEKDRSLLHSIGEGMRINDKLIWINQTLRRIKADNPSNVVVTDVRKMLEYSYLKEHGWHMVMVYCKPEVALQRLRDRDGGDIREDLVLNSPLENELRPLLEHMPVIDNSGTIDETRIQIEKFVKSIQQH